MQVEEEKQKWIVVLDLNLYKGEKLLEAVNKVLNFSSTPSVCKDYKAVNNSKILRNHQENEEKDLWVKLKAAQSVGNKI